MCGLTGIINHAEDYDVEENSRLILNLLDHRGPDHTGKLKFKKNLFCHNRLSIIDLTHKAAQPFSIKGLHLIYNGECYNYKELRKELEYLNHKFVSESDTEVILRCYIQYGINFVSKLNGMFALSIYDEKKGKTIIARDHSGIKPLYWATIDKMFLFSSEIKPILVHQKEFEINSNSLALYLKYRFVPGEETLFGGIYNFPNGSVWVVDDSGHILEKRTFWSVDDIQPQKASPGRKFLSAFTSIFRNSCSLQTRSDVPIGVLLSGGIDSASIASCVSEGGEQVNSFTMNMKKDLGEGAKAKSIADQLKINHYLVTYDDDDLSAFEKAIYHLENPLGDSIIGPTYSLFSNVSKKNKVVFSGEGADEILNGYVHHFALYYQDLFFRFLPLKFIRILGHLINKIPIDVIEKIFPYPARLGKNGVNKIMHQIQNYDRGFHSYSDLIELFTDKELASCGIKVKSNPIKEFFDQSRFSFIDTVTRADLKFWNTNYTLHRLDKLSMANSVEARVPFMDHRLVELCVASRKNNHFRNFRQKVVLRSFLRNQARLSPSVYERKKYPFYLPIDPSRSQVLLKWLKSSLYSHFSKEIFCKELLDEIDKTGDSDLLSSKKLVAVAILSSWHRIFSEFHKKNKI